MGYGAKWKLVAVHSAISLMGQMKLEMNLSQENFGPYFQLGLVSTRNAGNFFLSTISGSALLEFCYSFTPDVFFSTPGGFDVLGKLAKSM